MTSVSMKPSCCPPGAMQAAPTPFPIARQIRAAAFLLALGTFGAQGQAQAPAAGGAGAPPAPPPLPVKVLAVSTQKVPLTLDTVGRSEGSREVEIRARVAGILQERKYHEGASVRAGDLLFQIERAPLEITLAQAQAALAQERARNEQATREANRLRGLAQDRAISQREYDDASSSLKLSAAAVQAAEARVREAELNLSYTTVTAPISGITGRALRSEGTLVTPGADSSLLTTLTQTDPIWVRFALSDAENQRLRAAGERKTRVRVTLPDGKEYPTAGRVNFAASSMDTRLGTIQVRAELPNPKLAMLPGQYLRVKLVLGEEEAIVVPQTAVLSGEQGRFVWVIGAENKVAPRPVVVGSWVGKDWVIRSGLKAGEQIALDNLIKIRPGMTVAPTASGAAPAGGPAGASAPAGAPAAAARPAAPAAAPNAAR